MLQFPFLSLHTSQFHPLPQNVETVSETTTSKQQYTQLGVLRVGMTDLLSCIQHCIEMKLLFRYFSIRVSG